LGRAFYKTYIFLPRIFDGKKKRGFCHSKERNSQKGGLECTPMILDEESFRQRKMGGEGKETMPMQGERAIKKGNQGIRNTQRRGEKRFGLGWGKKHEDGRDSWSICGKRQTIPIGKVFADTQFVRQSLVLIGGGNI